MADLVEEEAMDGHTWLVERVVWKLYRCEVHKHLAKTNAMPSPQSTREMECIPTVTIDSRIRTVRAERHVV